MINYLKKNNELIIYILIFFVCYKNLFLYGDFVRDDWATKALYDLSFIDALKQIYPPFSNRPFTAIFLHLHQVSESFILFSFKFFLIITSYI